MQVLRGSELEFLGSETVSPLVLRWAWLVFSAFKGGFFSTPTVRREIPDSGNEPKPMSSFKDPKRVKARERDRQEGHRTVTEKA